MARAGYPILKDQIEYIEIGNEPNSYPGRGQLKTYTPRDYITEFREYLKAVSKAIGLAPGNRKYQAIALGSPDSFQPSDSGAKPDAWYPDALFEAGLSSSVGEISAVSMHWYQTLGQTGNPEQLSEEPMNQTIMVNQMAFYQPAIKYCR